MQHLHFTLCCKHTIRPVLRVNLPNRAVNGSVYVFPTCVAYIKALTEEILLILMLLSRSSPPSVRSDPSVFPDRERDVTGSWIIDQYSHSLWQAIITQLIKTGYVCLTHTHTHVKRARLFMHTLMEAHQILICYSQLSLCRYLTCRRSFNNLPVFCLVCPFEASVIFFHY